MNRHECTPANITPAIVELAESIVVGAKPIFTPVKPLPFSKPNECFHNVNHMVELNGGKRILGRVLWQWANIMVEAEAHAIWESPDLERLDITPNSYNESRILFLEEPEMEYHGNVIGNIRFPLTNSPIVKELVAICEEMECIISATTGAEVAMPAALVVRRQELTRQLSAPAGRNDKCPCGFELKFKKCCGK